MLQDIAAVATALAVFIAVWQLWESKRVARSQFEDTLNAQYRSLLAELPLDALLGKTLQPAELEQALPVFYRYFDLSNEQAFLHSKGRVSSATWANWRDGIEQNLSRPSFLQAWAELLPNLDGSFDDLNAVLATSKRLADHYARVCGSSADSTRHSLPNQASGADRHAT